MNSVYKNAGVVLLCLLMMSCSILSVNDDDSSSVAVTSVTVSGNTSVTVGDTISLTATIKPTNAAKKTVSWKVIEGSSYGAVASNGDVWGKAAGTVKVTATAGGVTSAAYSVTVVAATTTDGTATSSDSSSDDTSSSSSDTASAIDDSVTAGATICTSTSPSATTFVATDTTWDTLVWSDEFEGTALKTANWAYDTGAGGWGNSELETYTASAENAKVHGNVLDIAAKTDLTSARIKSSGLRTFQYGKIVARIKCSQGTGSWPAFWMLGTGADSWPSQGEIDILEHANSDVFAYETCHWNSKGMTSGSDYTHASYGGKTNDNNCTTISSLDVTQWHTYAIEWTSTLINFFVDDTKVMAMTISENSTEGLDAFCHPFYLIFNFAMGGQFPNIYQSASFTNVPWHMYVDYVRCYQ